MAAANPVNAGDYRHRVTIESRPNTKNPTTGGWSSASAIVVQRVPAYVEPLGGSELTRALQIDPRSRYNVYLRYPFQAISPRMFVVYHSRDGDKRLEILNVQNIGEANRQIVLTCGEAIEEAA